MTRGVLAPGLVVSQAAELHLMFSFKSRCRTAIFSLAYNIPVRELAAERLRGKYLSSRLLQGEKISDGHAVFCAAFSFPVTWSGSVLNIFVLYSSMVLTISRRKRSIVKSPWRLSAGPGVTAYPIVSYYRLNNHCLTKFSLHDLFVTTETNHFAIKTCTIS